MKISLATNQFFQDDGIPLSAGRITVCLHDSDTLADIYYLVGNDYVQAQNPLICDEAGRIPTVFFEAAVVDVRVESSNGDGTYALVDTYEDGFVMNPGADGSTAIGMGGLRNADTSIGTVTVVGYNSASDCPPRNYVWDPGCTLPDDGGCIISSDIDPDGRWILLYDDMFLPSTFYGISENDDSGISAFLTYPAQAGQWNIPLPPYPRFLRGTYGTQGGYTSDKTIAFDRDVQFTDASITCRSAIVFDNDSYICDFTFTADDCTAHSSWFRTATEFLLCGANTLVIDSRNYFTNNSITGAVGVKDKVVEAHTTLPFIYVNSGRITFDNCAFIGEQFIPTSAKVSFSHTVIKEEWFSGNYSSFDFVNNTIARSSSMNTLILDNFKNPLVYIKAMEADGKDDIDLAGRKVSSLTSSKIRTLRNAVVDTLSIDATGSNLVLRNVTSTKVSVTCNQLAVYDSDIKFWNEPSISSIFAYHSRVHSQYPWTGMAIQCDFEYCNIGISFHRNPDNTTLDSPLTFIECDYLDNCAVYSKNIRMTGCNCFGTDIRVYPYYDGSAYRIFVQLQGNTFNSAYPIVFTKVDDDACHDCIANWTIVDNSFLGNTDGLQCRYWSNRTGSYFDSVFIVPDTRSAILYRGNTGACPDETMKGCSIAAGATPSETYDMGGIYVYAFHSVGTSRRCCPLFTRAESATAHQKLYDVASQASNDIPVVTDTSDDLNMSAINGVKYWQCAERWDDRDGDFFDLALCVWRTSTLDSHWNVLII